MGSEYVDLRHYGANIEVEQLRLRAAAEKNGLRAVLAGSVGVMIHGQEDLIAKFLISYSDGYYEYQPSQEGDKEDDI